MVTDSSLTPHWLPESTDTGGHGGDFAYSGCAAYGVHLGDQGNVKMDMHKSGKDEQVVSSAHETERIVK